MAARAGRAHRLLALRPTRRHPLPDLVRLAKARWRIEHDYRELKTALGLDHFEGRSWTGWHRHVTRATAAQLFLTQLRLANPKADGQT
jgi:SRSO17 transposase